jgi:adenosine/AMP kinase
MDFDIVPLTIPDGVNVIFGQAHFIKTVEDLYEVVTNGVSEARFGVAFAEASGVCLVRTEGNDPHLTRLAAENIVAIGAGHTFLILLRGAYPINILTAVKLCPEVCRVFCATANALQVVVVRTAQGNGVVAVIDGSSPRGIEDDNARRERKQLLRTIGYKLC